MINLRGGGLVATAACTGVCTTSDAASDTASNTAGARPAEGLRAAHLVQRLEGTGLDELPVARGQGQVVGEEAPAREGLQQLRERVRRQVVAALHRSDQDVHVAAFSLAPPVGAAHCALSIRLNPVG